MTSKKYIDSDGKWFCHNLNETYVWYGLFNVINEYIGYWYQDNRKGFWLRKRI